jgi:hypothetical protein
MKEVAAQTCERLWRLEARLKGPGGHDVDSWDFATQHIKIYKALVGSSAVDGDQCFQPMTLFQTNIPFLCNKISNKVTPLYSTDSPVGQGSRQYPGDPLW